MTPEERIQQLEDENLLLREALGMSLPLRAKFGLTPMEAQTIGMIARHKEGASTERLMTALYAHTDEPCGPGSMRVRISNARRKLSRFGIELKSWHGLGYWFEDESRQKVLAG